MTRVHEPADFSQRLAHNAELVNRRLAELARHWPGIEPRLRDAVLYTLHAPGKRVRAALTLWCCALTEGRINEDALHGACAVEMVHTYSLVHDDLPAMDDDDLRRGRPSCHKAFDEATAILTGDALLTMAFEVLADKISDPQRGVSMAAALARAAGPAGMIAGQMADLIAETDGGDEEALRYIHINKTARMFVASAQLGAIAGAATEHQVALLGEYGMRIGLGFQITDDLLDISATTAQLGKTAGKDAAAGKLTYPALVGVERSRQIAEQLTAEAVEILEPFGRKAEVLRQLASGMLERSR